jgi:hypothetical protein
VSEQDEAFCAGQAALLRAAWQEARDHFETALAQDETPEALEGLGAAAWWLSDVSIVFAARERAYRLYRERKDDRGTARVAAALAIDYCTFRGRAAIASGWVWRDPGRRDGHPAVIARSRFGGQHGCIDFAQEPVPPIVTQAGNKRNGSRGRSSLLHTLTFPVWIESDDPIQTG